MPTRLEKQLKQIVRDHPDVTLHPHSPSGPHVRAVMFQARPGIIGNAHWQPQGAGGYWVALAFHAPTGEPSLVVSHPASKADLPRAISALVSKVRKGAGVAHPRLI